MHFTERCGAHITARKKFRLIIVTEFPKNSILQDPDLQALLPFGEYVPPEHSSVATSAILGIEPWDVDRLLQRLALQNSTAGNRRQRARSRPFSLPDAHTGMLSVQNFLHNSHDKALNRTLSAGNTHSASHMAATESSGNNRVSNQASSSQTAEASFPSSWPPSGASLQVWYLPTLSCSQLASTSLYMRSSHFLTRIGAIVGSQKEPTEVAVVHRWTLKQQERA